jgi:hypothetical protein
MILGSNEFLRQEVIRLAEALEKFVESEKTENDKAESASSNLCYMPEDIEERGFGRLPREIEGMLISAPGIIRSELLR